MHNAALAHLGIFAKYEALDVPPEDLPAVLATLRNNKEMWGANLTIPHKETATELVDVLSKEARAIGAVNTIIRRKEKLGNDKLIGHNTDAAGFIESLKEAGWAVQQSTEAKAVVLGAGGAGRAVVFALLRAGINVQIHNRTAVRAEQLAQSLGAQFLDDKNFEEAVQTCDLLVNTTSLGLEDKTISPLPHALLPKKPSALVVDIVYKPLQTKLLQDANNAGLKTVDGLGMLVHQGVLALNAWLNSVGILRQASASVMRQAALEVLQKS